MGVTRGAGINNIGLFVKTCEYDLATQPTLFVIDDGSGVDVRCEVPSNISVNKSWTHVAITGISRLSKVGETYKRRIAAREVDGITVSAQ